MLSQSGARPCGGSEKAIETTVGDLLLDLKRKENKKQNSYLVLQKHLGRSVLLRSGYLITSISS